MLRLDCSSAVERALRIDLPGEAARVQDGAAAVLTSYHSSAAVPNKLRQPASFPADAADTTTRTLQALVSATLPQPVRSSDGAGEEQAPIRRSVVITTAFPLLGN